MPPVIPSKEFDPVILYANTTLATGSAAAPNSVALTNPYGLPMEVYEVRFGLYAPALTNLDGSSGVPGSAVGVGMRLGTLPIIDDEVPISTFAGAMRGEAKTGIGVGTSDDEPVSVYPYVYWWRPKYPIFVPPGATLEPTFQNLGQVQQPISVHVTYSCRVYGDPSYRPSRLMLPWVGSYNSKTFEMLQTATAADQDNSTELDIINPFDVPLEVERIVGRQVQIFTQNEGSSLTTAIVEEVGNPSEMYNSVKLTMKSSRGDDIVRDPTLFGTLFTDSVNEWNIGGGWVMDPSEYYKIFLQRDAVAAAQIFNIGRVQFFVTLAGYREVK